VTPEERAHAAIVEHLFREFGLGMETLARYQRMVAGSIRAAVEEEREACAAMLDYDAQLQETRAEAEDNDYAAERAAGLRHAAFDIRARSKA
jgi:hypothetical protein